MRGSLRVHSLRRALCVRTARSFSSQTQGTRQGGGPVSWRGLAVILGVGTGGLAYFALEKERRMQEIMRPRAVGRAAIGGPFELIDGDGRRTTEKDLLGRWTLIYFGFTMCPDICPAELTKIAEGLQTLELSGVKIGKDSESLLTPVFVSVDPERDTPQQSAEYAQEFHAAFVGLSGTLDQVRAAAKAYRVYYSKDNDESEEYLVDHSIITYLMDPEGEFSEFYGKNVTAPEMAARIQAKMLAWKPQHR